MFDSNLSLCRSVESEVTGTHLTLSTFHRNNSIYILLLIWFVLNVVLCVCYPAKVTGKAACGVNGGDGWLELHRGCGKA